MDDTPYVNDGADASLRKTVSLLNKIEANTSSTPAPVTLGTSSNPTVVKLNYFAGSAVGTDGGPADLTAVRVGYNSNSGNEFLAVSESTGLPISGIDLGAKADSVASSDTGTFSVLAFIKRGLQNWTTLLAKIPTLVSGRIPVDGSGVTQPVSGTVALDSASLAALENISVTFPATQNVNVTNAGLSVSVSNLPATQPVSGSVSVSNLPATQPVSLATAPTTPVTGTFWQATQPVSIASAPVTPVTDNGGSLTVDGSVSVSNFPATQPVSGSVSVSNFPATQSVSGTFWQTTQPVSLASAPVTPVTDNGGSLTVDGIVTVNDMTSGNAKTKIVDSTGADVSYIPAGTAGTSSSSVLSVQGISGGTSLPISGTVDTGLTQPLTNTQLRATAVPVSGAFFQATQPISGTVNTYPQQGTTATNTNFSSITSAELAPEVANRESLTVYNEGPGTLFINVGGSCSTTSYQVRLFPGDYWEAPAGQLSLQHSGIFGTAGTARAVQVS
jgi:hypothetical protein